MLLNFMNVEVYEEGGTRYTYYSLLEPSYDTLDDTIYIINHWKEQLLIINDGEDGLFNFLNNQNFEEVYISFNPISSYDVINKEDFKKWIVDYSNNSEIPLSKALINCIMNM